MIINIPNFITLGRIISVPVIFWLLLSGQSKIAFFVFVCAGISDAVDGYLAKRFDWTTELGSYLDPLADKLLIVSIFIALGVRNELPLWLVIAVVSRDILIVAAVLLAWLLEQRVRDQAAGGEQGQHALPDRAGRNRPGRRRPSASGSRRAAWCWCGLREH